MATTSTTSSSTSGAAGAQQTATQQLLSSLNAGSGIDFNTLATNLAAASFATRIDTLNSRSDKLDKQISAASEIKSALSNLANSLGDRVRQGDLSSQPQIVNSSVASGKLSGSQQPSGTFSLEVTKLATSQTLVSPAYSAANQHGRRRHAHPSLRYDHRWCLHRRHDPRRRRYHHSRRRDAQRCRRGD
jgi:flagellar hook-associated protein 2